MHIFPWQHWNLKCIYTPYHSIHYYLLKCNDCMKISGNHFSPKNSVPQIRWLTKQSHLSCHFGFFPWKVRHQLDWLWALMSRVYSGILQAIGDLHHKFFFMFRIWFGMWGRRTEKMTSILLQVQSLGLLFRFKS